MARSSVPVQALLAFISAQEVVVQIGEEERRLTPQDLMDPKCFRAATEAYEKAQKSDGGEDKEKGKRKKNTAHMLLVSSGSVVQIRSVQNTILEKAGAEGALQTYALLNSLPEEETEIVMVVETDDSFTFPKEGDLETFLSRLGVQVSV